LDLQSAWAFVAEIIIRRGGIVIAETALHAEVAARCMMDAPRLQGNQLHDFRLAVQMREHGIKTILTEDRDFNMFPWVEIRSLSDA
jgi:predicted nucleic acid-binding protein